jgi:hypothetical protein
MSKEELDLLQLASGRMAELRARAPQVVRSDTSKTNFGGVQLDDVPHHSLCDAVTPAFSGSANTPK